MLRKLKSIKELKYSIPWHIYLGTATFFAVLTPISIHHLKQTPQTTFGFFVFGCLIIYLWTSISQHEKIKKIKSTRSAKATIENTNNKKLKTVEFGTFIWEGRTIKEGTCIEIFKYENQYYFKTKGESRWIKEIELKCLRML